MPDSITSERLARLICAQAGIDMSRMVGLRIECKSGDVARLHVEYLVTMETGSAIAKAFQDYKIVEAS